MVRTTEVAARAASPSWSEAEPVPAPTATIVVATHDRAGFVPDLINALEQQTSRDYEVVVVDDASSDETWATLERSVATASRPVLALRLARGGGPSVARNVGAVHARGAWLAFTDDDCLPAETWLERLLAAGASALVVQGRTMPPGSGRPGPWARTIDVREPTALYETCNLGVRRDAFLAADGFAELGYLSGPASRGFGEDAALGARVAARGGRAWAVDAVVEHRWLPGTYADHVRGLARLVGFPALVSEVPEVADATWHRYFLSPRTAAFDAAVAGVVGAVATRRWGLLLAVVPYAAFAVRETRYRPGRARAIRVAQVAAADAVGFAALVAGSIRARRLLI